MAEDLSLFQEIDDSLRVEKLEQFWHRFGNLVIAGCVGIVLLTAASVLWKNHQREAHMKQTGIMLRASAMAQEGKYDDAIALLEGATQGTKGLAALARLQQADAWAKKGDKDKARAAYAAIAHDSHAENGLRDFAALEAGIIASNQHAADASMDQAARAGSAFAISAQEIEAAQLLSEGKSKDAIALLKPIADDMTAPTSQRSRAMELLDMASETPQ